jgi:hypothetical protein
MNAAVLIPYVRSALFEIATSEPDGQPVTPNDVLVRLFDLRADQRQVSFSPGDRAEAVSS